MRFSTKIISFAAVPAILFVLALASSIGSLVNTREEFDRYINSEQAVERGLSEMYAQGLQMGQALRNVVLDPANPKALENLKTAQSAYEAAYTQAAATTKGSAFESGLSQLPALRAIHATAQEIVLALVADKGDAIPVLNKEETPAWRELRGALLKQGDSASLMGVMKQMQESLQTLVKGVRVSANGIANATSEIAAGKWSVGWWRP